MKHKFNFISRMLNGGSTVVDTPISKRSQVSNKCRLTLGRLSALLFALLLCVGQMWAGDCTFKKGTTIYLNLNGNDWPKDGGKPSAMFYYLDNPNMNYGDKSTSWGGEMTESKQIGSGNYVLGTQVSGDYWKVTVPDDGLAYVRFVRVQASNAEWTWNCQKNKLSLADMGGNNCVKLGGWDANASWENYSSGTAVEKDCGMDYWVVSDNNNWVKYQSTYKMHSGEPMGLKLINIKGSKGLDFYLLDAEGNTIGFDKFSTSKSTNITSATAGSKTGSIKLSFESTSRNISIFYDGTNIYAIADHINTHSTQLAFPGDFNSWGNSGYQLSQSDNYAHTVTVIASAASGYDSQRAKVVKSGSWDNQLGNEQIDALSSCYPVGNDWENYDNRILIKCDGEMAITPTVWKADGDTKWLTLIAIPTTKYNVTFSSAHGSVPATQSVAYDGVPSKPADPSESGWTFQGWYTSDQYTKEYDFSVAIHQATTIYAKWENSTPVSHTYSLQHPWGTGDDKDWSWKECDIDNGDGTYSLVAKYGGNNKGCDWKEDDTYKGYVTPTFVGSSPATGDECTFTLNPTTGTITITKNGVTPTLPYEYYMTGDLWDVCKGFNGYSKDAEAWTDARSDDNNLPFMAHMVKNGGEASISFVAPKVQFRFDIEEYQRTGAAPNIQIDPTGNLGDKATRSSEKYKVNLRDISSITGPSIITVTYNGSGVTINQQPYTPNPSAYAGWKVLLYKDTDGNKETEVGSLDANGQFVTDELTNGTKYRLRITDGTGGKLCGINWFGGLYFDQTSGTDIVTYPTITYHGNDGNKFDPSSWPVAYKYNATGVFTMKANGKLQITFDGGKITINKVAAKKTVTFHSNGGTEVASQQVSEGGTATKPSDPTKNGNTFQNWYSNSDCTGDAFNFNTPITTDIDLYAKWTPSGTIKFVSSLGKKEESSTIKWDANKGIDFTNNNGVYTVTYMAPKGRNHFEAWADGSDSKKVPQEIDPHSPVTIGQENGHMYFDLTKIQQVTITYNGKFSVSAQDYTPTFEDAWYLTTGGSWNGKILRPDGSEVDMNADWKKSKDNGNNKLYNVGGVNALIVLRVPSGDKEFKLIRVNTDDCCPGKDVFNALYVDTSNPPSGLTWSNSHDVDFGTDVPHTDGNTTANWRNIKFNLSKQMDLIVRFDGGKITISEAPPAPATYRVTGAGISGNDWDLSTHTMEEVSTGIYCYTESNMTARQYVEFKVTKNGSLDNSLGWEEVEKANVKGVQLSYVENSNNNIKFNVPNYTSDVKFYTNGTKVWVEVVPKGTEALSGNWYVMGYGGDWNPTNPSNQMTITDGVASKTYKNNMGDFDFKVYGNGTEHGWSYYSQDKSNVTCTKVDAAISNIKIPYLSEPNDITISYDGVNVYVNATPFTPSLDDDYYIFGAGGTDWITGWSSAKWKDEYKLTTDGNIASKTFYNVKGECLFKIWKKSNDSQLKFDAVDNSKGNITLALSGTEDIKIPLGNVRHDVTVYTDGTKVWVNAYAHQTLGNDNWVLAGDYNGWGENYPLSTVDDYTKSITVDWDYNTFPNDWKKCPDLGRCKILVPWTWEGAYTRDHILAEASSFVAGTDCESGDTRIVIDLNGHPQRVTFTIWKDNSGNKKVAIKAVDVFAVTFDSKGGSEVAKQYVEANAHPTQPAAPTKDGYTFLGWSETDGGSIVDVTTVTINAAKTFYAKWEAKSYSISYKNRNNEDFTGTNLDALPKTHTYGTTTILVAAEPPTGCDFQGWYKDAACTGTAVTEIGATEITDNITLYAKILPWGCVSYSFQYGGDDVKENNTVECFTYTGVADYSEIANFVIPNAENYFVGDRGWFQESDLGHKGAKSCVVGMQYLPLEATMGEGDRPKIGNAIGAIGTLRVCDNSTWDNIYVTFRPNGYGLMYGANATENTLAMHSTGATTWQTDPFMLTEDMKKTDDSYKYQVGLLKSDNTYIACGHSDKYNFGDVGSYCSAWGGTGWGSNVSSYAAGRYGVIEIWIDNLNKNWCAHFTPYYRLHYDLNGGTSTTITDEFRSYALSGDALNTTVAGASDVTRTGYNLTGWKDQNGTSVSAGSTLAINQDNIILTAQWQAKKYSITLDKGTKGTADGSATATYDSNTLFITHVDTPARYTLEGYYTAATDGTLVINADGTLVANVSGYTGDAGKWIKDGDATLYAHFIAQLTLDAAPAIAAPNAEVTVTPDLTDFSKDIMICYALYKGSVADANKVEDVVFTITKSGDNKGQATFTAPAKTGTYIVKADVHSGNDCSAETILSSAQATVTVKPLTNTFTNEGGDNLWSNTANWSENMLPDAETEVTIRAKAIVDIPTAAANTVIIDDNGHDAEIEILSTGGLQVEETITRTDGKASGPTTIHDLYIHSDAFGTGALVFDNSNNCQAYVEYYSIASGAPKNCKWQWMATPFSDVNNAEYNYYGSWLNAWDSGSRGWKTVKNGAGLTAFQAYCLTQETAGHTYVMEGTLAPTADRNVVLSYDEKLGGRAGLNLFGNSWSAPINIGAWKADDFTNAEATIVILNTGLDENGTGAATMNNDAAGQYISIPVEASELMKSTLQVIPAMQAFQVRATGAEASLKMNYDQLVRKPGEGLDIKPMRAPERKGAPRIDKNEVITLRMDITGTRYHDFLYLFQHPQFTDGFDNGWDGEKILGDLNAVQLYVMPKNAADMAVSAQPMLNGTQLGFYRGEDDFYTITFDYNGTETLYLYDANTDEYTEVKNGNSYTFYSSTYDLELRFMLTNYNPKETVITGSDELDLHDATMKYIHNEQLHIRVNGNTYNAIGEKCVK